MSSLVEELQRDALDHRVTVTSLLQKGLVVATKLKLDEFAAWVRLELDGYGEEEVPQYRVLGGAPQVFNPYRGYQPLHFPDAQQTKAFSRMHFNSPVGVIEHDLIRATESGSAAFHVGYAPTVEHQLMEAIEFNLQPSLQINASRFRALLDAVRKIVLEWSLRLEADGITGDGMSFSKEEKEKAESVTYNVKNLIQGNIHDSQVQIEAENSSQTQVIEFDSTKILDFVEAIRATKDALGIGENDKAELESEMLTLEAQAQSPTPKNTIITESLASVRRILEGAGGNLVASGMLNQLGTIFGV